LVEFVGSARDEHQEQEPVGDERPVNAHCSSLIPHPSSLVDAATGVPQAIGGSITSAAPLGPLGVPRQVQPRKLVGRKMKRQSPLSDTPRNWHTSPASATTSTSLRPAWRKAQTRLGADPEWRKRLKMRHSCWPTKALRRPWRCFPSVYGIIRSDMTHAIAASQKAWWRTLSRFAPRRKLDSARDLHVHGRHSAEASVGSLLTRPYCVLSARRSSGWLPFDFPLNISEMFRSFLTAKAYNSRTASDAPPITARSRRHEPGNTNQAAW
jgi:hypothetical protein